MNDFPVFRLEIGTRGEIVEIREVFGAELFGAMSALGPEAASRNWGGHGVWD